MSKPAFDIDRLTTDERLRLLDELWESLRRSSIDIPLTDAQAQELDRRLDELDQEGPSGIPWAEVERRITGRSA